ncbi:MAG: ribosome-associated translation inhibitor RaiA [Candidatus Brennerbacteria bacterium]|nr:ribosome-associated translation inhibitor RaiA [Candidatus Brennerbacteria bacterium]
MIKFNLKSTNLDITPSLENYFETKIGGLERFLKHWSKEGAVEVWAELARTTKHHHKGDVFRAELDVRLPGKILRAEAKAEDARRAIDLSRVKMLGEIKKYKTKILKSRYLNRV